MRIKLGDLTQLITFIATDATDGFTRETGLTGFTVYYSLNSGTATVMTTPTTAELDATNMAGVYTLLVDESGMTSTKGELTIHITHASIADYTRSIEVATNLENDIYDIVNHASYGNAQLTRSTTPANTLNVDANNRAEVLLGAVTHTGAVVPTVSVLTGHTAQTGDTYGALPTNFSTTVISGGGAIDSLVQGFLNVTITEGTAGRIADNFDTLFNNGDVLSTLTLATMATTTAQTTAQNDLDTLLTRITSTLFSGITSLGEWIGMLAGKQSGDATALTEIRATGAGSGTFDPTTDAEESIRDRGDSSWTTGAGGSDRLLMVDTTIDTLASQVSFTLTAGSADDKAYENCTIVIEDASTSTQKALGVINTYTGATKTVELKYDPGVFTMVATDKVYILAEKGLKTATSNRQIAVDANGRIDIGSWLGTVVTTSATSAKPEVDAYSISDDAAASNNLETACDNYSATRGLSGTALPAAAADGVGGLPISDAGGLDLDTQLAATNEITAARMGTLTDWINGGRLDLIIDAIKVEADKIALSDAGAGVAGSVIEEIENRSTPAQVNTEVVDVLKTDTISELAQGVPSVTPTFENALMLLYMALRDKLDVTSGYKEVHNNAGTVICKKALSDDGTTYSEANMETGP